MGVQKLVNARIVPASGAVLALLTLAGVYLTATLVEHKPFWPPLDISHYSKDVPASFVFRSGMIPACVTIALTWILSYQWQKELADQATVTPRLQSLPRLCAYLGSVGAGCLVVSSALLDGNFTAWTPHVICASSFFLLTLACSVMTTLSLRALRAAGAPVNLQRLRQRMTLNALGFILLIADAAVALLKAPGWYGNLIEWLLTFDVLLYIVVFAFDWEQSNGGYQIDTNLGVSQQSEVIAL